MTARWQALVLAAGRGPGDPMAKAYGVTHKCRIAVGGQPMLDRVVATLKTCPAISAVAVSIEAEDVLGDVRGSVGFVPAEASAALSTMYAARSGAVAPPFLLTTADHPLLTAEMVAFVLAETERSGADLAVGLATAETILGAYPEARRTFLRFGRRRVSGCNLFALRTARALNAVERWQGLDQARKRPWRLVSAFGPLALARFALRRLSLDQAFAVASRQLGLTARPILLPFADAAIDVDKPADKDLAERILRTRG